MLRRLLETLAFSFLLLPSLAAAAGSAVALTPTQTSVLAGLPATFSARFTDTTGQVASGAVVQFQNDSCGTFPNGLTFISVNADANGIASTTFTAGPGGVVCTVIASTPAAQVSYRVITFSLAQVSIDTTLSPVPLSPATPFTVVATARMGIYPLQQQDFSARIVAGTASASVAPGSANSGDSGSVSFVVTPDGRTGNFDVMVDFSGLSKRIPVSYDLRTMSWQDLWWSGPVENGWGMSIVQHGEQLFAVIYAYDDAGKPTWFVVPGGTWNAAHTAFTGAVYVPHGSAFFAYDASRFSPGSAVGSATLTFADAQNAELDFVINGSTGRKAIARQAYGPVDPTVVPNAGDMWWGGAAQNGWGLAVMQQYATLFAVWFTYDANGAPTWFVMPAGTWSDAATSVGRVFTTTGSPWLGHAYDASAFRATDAGAFQLRFSGAGPSAATFDYNFAGRSGSLSLVRQPF